MKTILVCLLTCTVMPLSLMAQDQIPIERKHPAREGSPEVEGKHGKFPGALGPRARGDLFKRMDTNADGDITREEFFAVVKMDRMPEEKRDLLFSRLDRDGDGKVTKQEIDNMRKNEQQKRAREFRQLDEDQSGGLSFEEFSKREFLKKLPEEKRRQIFNRMDTDGDGQITLMDRPRGPRTP